MKEKFTWKEATHYLTALAVGGTALWISVKYTGKNYGLNEKSDLRPKIEIDSNYKAQLVKLPSRHNVTIYNKEGEHLIYGIDYNKDTIIDEISLGTTKLNSTIQRLASVKELSKIEKELLEK